MDHEEWFGVGAAVLGIPIDADTKTKLMATRGVKKRKKDEKSDQPGGEECTDDKKNQTAAADVKPEAEPSRDTKISFTNDTNTEPRKRKPKKERLDHTGVVHFVSNKIRMKNQKVYFDGRKPLVLLIPCMTLEQAKGWRGEKYTAVFLAGLPRDCMPPAEYNNRRSKFFQRGLR